MRKLGKQLVANLVACVRNTQDEVEYGETYVRIRRGETHVTCHLNGNVTMFGLWGEPIPFDWDQRRGIARAVRWRHKIEQERLIRLGEQAARQAKGASNV